MFSAALQFLKAAATWMSRSKAGKKKKAEIIPLYGYFMTGSPCSRDSPVLQILEPHQSGSEGALLSFECFYLTHPEAVLPSEQ